MQLYFSDAKDKKVLSSINIVSIIMYIFSRPVVQDYTERGMSNDSNVYIFILITMITVATVGYSVCKVLNTMAESSAIRFSVSGILYPESVIKTAMEYPLYSDWNTYPQSLTAIKRP